MWQLFSTVKPTFAPYRDASYGNCTYRLTLLHCWRGLRTAVVLGHFSLESFDLRSYEFFERIQNGDMNWIVPGKFLAFSTPGRSKKSPEGVL